MDKTDKKCSKCGEVKSLGEFNKHSGKKDGYRSNCKCCDSKYYLKNKDRIAEYGKQYRSVTKEICSERGKQYRVANREYISEWKKQYYLENKDKIADHKKLYYFNNKEKVIDDVTKYRNGNKEKCYMRGKRWRAANVEAYRESARRYATKLRSTPRGKLNSNIKTAIWRSLLNNKGRRHWETLVGYSLEDLKNHLEKQFLHGMSWDNYGDWHVDHKIPLAVHHYETAEDIDFKRAWSLKNLQPMWAFDNLSKGARIETPFQPSLMM